MSGEAPGPYLARVGAPALVHGERQREENGGGGLLEHRVVENFADGLRPAGVVAAS